MPGLGVGDHQVARHPVAVHRDLRLGQRARHEAVAGVGPGRARPRRTRWRSHSRATHHSGKSASSRRSSASSYGGSAAPGSLPCQTTSAAIASRISASARPVSPAACARLQRREVELVAEIVEEQKAVRRDRLRGRAARAGRPAAIRPATWTKGRTSSCGGGASMTMTLPPPCEVGAQVAAKAGIARRRPKAGDDQAARARRRAASQAAKAVFRAGSAQANRGRQQGRIHRAAAIGVRGASARASWIIDSTNRCAIASARPSGYASSPSQCRRSWRVARPHRLPPSRRLRARQRRRARPASSCATPPRCSRRRAARPASRLPIILQARELRGRPDLDAEAERRRRVPPRRGRHPLRPAELRPGRGPRARHRQRRRQPRRQRLHRAGAAAAGRALRGLLPQPDLSLRPHRRRRQGDAIEFIDDQRAVAIDATYSSCSPRRPRDPAWILKAGRIEIDNETNDGVAHDAVLRFYGVPILASPVLSFPLNDERRSGLLPPTFGLDSRSGFQVAVPVLLEHRAQSRRDLHAVESTRRGPALDDRVPLSRSRATAGEAELKPAAERPRRRRPFAPCAPLPPRRAPARRRVRRRRAVLRVSDDDYWKDFPGDRRRRRRACCSPTCSCTRPFGDWSTYARVQRWQVLQTVDPTTRIDPPPYERLPQIGTRYAATWRGGFERRLRGRVQPLRQSRRPLPRAAPDRRSRSHALGSISRPFDTPGWNFVPKVSFNAASLLARPASGRRQRAAPRA